VADDTTPDEPTDESVPFDPTDLAGDDAATPEPDQDQDLEPELSRAKQALQINASVTGTLVVHFPERDVRTVLDGLTAMRVLTCFARRSSQFADHVRLTSAAENRWFVVDLAAALAVSWEPEDTVGGLDQPVAFDPPA
jgi:hypothetical protein